MDFRVDTDMWFTFSILFISALAFFIFIYISIPYVTRKRQLKRIKHRYKRKIHNYKELEKKYTDRKILNLVEDNEKLQLSLENDLNRILVYNSKAPNLINFFSTFEKVHPNFKQSLQKIIPNITANELKLCAFLRLNLSSKEVSQLLNITQESVNKARYRLRKKLQLDSKEDLFIFLSSI